MCFISCFCCNSLPVFVVIHFLFLLYFTSVFCCNLLPVFAVFHFLFLLVQIRKPDWKSGKKEWLKVLEGISADGWRGVGSAVFLALSAAFFAGYKEDDNQEDDDDCKCSDAD